MNDGGLPPDLAETDIAVVGMALRVPGARTLDAFWRNLHDGVESVTQFTDDELRAEGVPDDLLADPNYVKSGAVLSDMEAFDAGFFGFNPREAAIMDPQHRHFLEVSWEALECAGHPPERFEGSIGVFGGSGHNAYMPYNLLTNPDLMESTGFFLVRHTGNDKDFLTTRVSYLLNLTGPSVNVQTACSTSLVAVHLATQSLLNGECDMALAGGITIELPHRRGYLYKDTEILSPDGHCRSFDADSKGTIFGSGVGVVVLRRLADAVEEGDFIHAVIKGSAINNDGAGKVGYLAPSVDGQAQAIAEALAIADVDVESVGYVEAHGTGTPVGDPIEVAALTQAFRQFTDRTGFCRIGSLKSNIGHLDTAAGVAGLVKVALGLQHGEIPPSLHFESPNPACHFEASPFVVNDTLTPWPGDSTPHRAGISSLGVGGTNVHVVLQEPPALVPGEDARECQLIALSAKTPAALDRATANLTDYLADHPELNLADVAYTLQVGRSAMPHRRIVAVDSAADLAAALEEPDAGRVVTGEAPTGERSVAFMFAGGGAQYPTMGAELYRTEPVYRAAVDECLELLDSMVDYDLKALLFPEPGAEEAAATELERPSITLPALFTTQYAQARLWASWGVEPGAMIGHSMGEYTAAHLAGVFDLHDALALVLLRGRLFEQVPPGGMLSVPLAAAELREMMNERLSIAAVNGPELSVASGPSDAIERLERELAERDVDSVRVRISIAAHSMMLEGILEEFEAFFRNVSLAAPQVPFISNLSGTWITAEEATDPGYWVRHLRNTVQFADGVRELFGDGTRALLEVGPGRTLATLARQHPDRPEDVAVVNSMRHPDDTVSDETFMHTSLGRLWLAGVTPDWVGLHGTPRRRVPLPTYPFERQRHWIEPGARPEATAAGGEADDLARRSDIGEWTYRPVWRQEVLPPSPGGAAITGGVALVCGGPDSLAQHLADSLAESGADVVRAVEGPDFVTLGPDRVALDPGRADHWHRLMAELNAGGRTPGQVFYLWPLAADSASWSTGQSLTASFYGPLFLAQAIGREDLTDDIRLALVSNRAVAVAGEGELEPVKATLQGPSRVIPREFPNVSSVHIDIDLPAEGSWRERRLAQLLIRELAAATEAGEDVVAYRGTGRWVQRFERIRLPDDGPARLRDRGVYLITGGLGGIGLTLAAHLARTRSARLVLVGRSELPPREEWEAWTTRHGPDEPLSRKIQGLLEVEQAGGEVLALSADVTDDEAMKRVVTVASHRFGVINGVFHTAGVLDDGIIQLKEPEAAAQVLAPKVQGTIALDRALAGQDLDFMVLFSSISSFSGLAGQVDYAAANAFLDAWAHHRMITGGPPTVAVNWSAWREVGMAADMARQLGIADDLDHESAGVPVDHPLLDRCVLDSRDERTYLTTFSVDRHWLLAEHRVRGGDALIPGTGYLEIARAAFEQHPQQRALELRDVSFLSPFAVGRDEERELRISLRRDGRTANAFVISSRRPVGDNGDSPETWQEHVRGTIGYLEGADRGTVALDVVGARCRDSEPVDQEEPKHLEFGPRWRNIERIRYGTGEALMDLGLDSGFLADLERYRLHPAVMDMATAGAQRLIPGLDPEADFYVPLSYGAVTVHAPLTPRVHSHIRYREDESAPGEFAQFDITVTDPEGAVLVDIAGFVMIRVRDKALLAAPTGAGAGATGEPTADTPHEAQKTANTVLSVGLEAGIMPAEGMTALESILSPAAPPQTIVSTQPLDALIAELRKPPEPPAGARRAAAAPAAPRRDLTPLEEALAGHEAVLEAAAREFEERPGDWRLVAYIVYDPEEDATVSELRRHIRRTLADGFVPHAFIELEQIPRAADGTVAHEALESPFAAAEELVAPRTETERFIAGLWHDLLGVEAVGVYDNFFDIGGHSLLSMRLISQVDKKLGVRLQHEHVVVNTLEQLAAKCDQQRGAEAGAETAGATAGEGAA